MTARCLSEIAHSRFAKEKIDDAMAAFRALASATTDRTGLPLLRDALAWFECQVVSEHPAGDHVLVLGKVIDGKLLDVEAEPMCYRETGGMDGASAL